MRNFPLFRLILASTLLGCLSGCSSDDPDVPQLTEDLSLSAVYVDGELYRAITYDEDKRIESVEEYDNGEFTGTQLFEYNDDGDIKTLWRLDANGEFQAAYAYEYEGGNLKKMLIYEELLEDPTYGASYEHNNSGQLLAVYYFVPSQPEKIQTYNKYEYDTQGNVVAQKNYLIKPDTPDILYFEQYYDYADPQRTATVREKLGKRPFDMMYLHTSSEVTNYNNDGSGDIQYAYSYEVDTEFNAQGWPVEATLSAHYTHPQYNESAATIAYEYIEW